MTDRVLAQIAALAKASLPDLKAQYRDLFGVEAPGINRAYLERRLAYKLQELAYGGLSQATNARLEALIERLFKEWYVAKHERDQSMSALIAMAGQKEKARKGGAGAAEAEPAGAENAAPVEPKPVPMGKAGVLYPQFQ